MDVEREPQEPMVIYTDGGCSGNPGPGAWAFVVSSAGQIRSRSGSSKQTTNNRMELTAVIQALLFIHDWFSRSVRLTVHTDSQYVKRGITEWIDNWRKSGWKTASKKPVKNQDLWKQLLVLRERGNIGWVWVPGHSGDALNEMCDALVKREIRECMGSG